MMSISIGGQWTDRIPGETLEQWAARVPAGDTAPDGCDHFNEWQSAAGPVKICTNCLGDETEEGCEARHQEALEFWQTKHPEV